MRVSREQAEKNRGKIVKVASELFREKGFDGVGVDEVMKKAGLTHGGFYNHFFSKEMLAAEASARALAGTATCWREALEEDPRSALNSIVDFYLGDDHCRDRSKGCAFAALAAEVPRHTKSVSRSFTNALRSHIDVLVHLVRGRTVAARQQHALATMSLLVGAVVLARAVDDAELSRSILDAAKAGL